MRASEVLVGRSSWPSSSVANIVQECFHLDHFCSTWASDECDHVGEMVGGGSNWSLSSVYNLTIRNVSILIAFVLVGLRKKCLVS